MMEGPRQISAQLFVQSPPLRYTAAKSISGSDPLRNECRCDGSINHYRVFVDEQGDDLVVLGFDEAYFSKIALSNEAGASQEEQVARSFVDALYIRTKLGNIFAARRCPELSAISLKHRIVAVMHSKHTVHFYRCPVGVTAPADSEEVVTPFTVWECQPNSLRFGSAKYPLRTFYWMPWHLDGGSTGATDEPSAKTSSAVIRSIVVLTEISIDLVDIFLEPSDLPPLLVKRVTTRVDYYHFNHSLRFMILVNQNKPHVVKNFLLAQRGTIKVLPQIKLEDPTSTPVSAAQMSQMQPPAFIVDVVSTMIYGDVYVLRMNGSQQLVMYKAVSKDNAIAFEKTAICDLPDASADHQLQFLDNLILVHNPVSSLSSLYDIRVNAPPPSLAVMADQPQPAAAPLAPPARSQSFGPFNPSFKALRRLGSTLNDDVPHIGPTSLPYPLTLGIQEQAGKGMQTDEIYQSVNFHQLSFGPVVLDRRTGTVSLVNLHISQAAMCIRNQSQSMQFLLNRFGCGGLMVPSMIKDLLYKYEPLPIVGHVFDLTCESCSRAIQAGEQSAASAELSPGRRRFGAGAQFTPPFLLPPPPQQCVAGDLEALGVIFPDVSSTFLQTESLKLLDYSDAMRFFPSPQAVLSHAEKLDPQLRLSEMQNDYIQRAIDDVTGSKLGKGLSVLTGASNLVDQNVMFRVVLLPFQESVARACVASAESAQGLSPGQESTEDAAVSPGEVPDPCYASRYFTYAVLEYTRSLTKQKQKLIDIMQRLVIDAFISGPRPDYFRLHQLLMYRAIDDQVPVAYQILHLENEYSPAFQMAIDMLSRLHSHTAIVNVFLVKRMPLRAAKYVVSNQLYHLPVLDILKCAADMDDEELEKVQQNPANQKRAHASGNFVITFLLIAKHIRAMERKSIASVPSREELAPYILRYIRLARNSVPHEIG